LEDASAASGPPGLIQGRKDEVFQYLGEIQFDLEALGLKVVKLVRVGNPAVQIAKYINFAPPACWL
jgi:hypothetical protein